MAAASSSCFSHSTIFLASNKFSSNSRRRCRAVTMAALAAVPQKSRSSYWSSIESEIDAYLKAAIPIRPPESVFEPMHHLTFAAPRTTAPALCVAACDLLLGDDGGFRTTPAVMAAASAIHLINAAAYTHRHLPLTATGPPQTLEHKFGPNIELLTGDGIIPFGMELLARSMDPDLNNQDRILRVIIEISRAGGSQGLVDGMYRESSEQVIIEEVCMKKEGELHACGAACGAILGGGSEEEIKKLRKFGLYVGIAQGLLIMARKKNNNNIEMEEKAGKYKELALKELENGFQDGKKIRSIEEIIGSIVDEASVRG